MAGIATALVAAVPGVIDYLTLVPEGRPAGDGDEAHAVEFRRAPVLAAAGWAANGNPRAERETIGLELLGTSLISIGGWLGGSLSYHHQIGVDPEEPRALAPAHLASGHE